jgi:SAM-dependent methyltransferase
MVTEARQTCRLCGGPARSILTTTDRNRAISDERFEYHRCTRCGVWFLANVPADLANYYPTHYYDVPAPEQRDALIDSERHKLARLLRLVGPGRMVEIGPGYGLFASVARDAGFDVTAIEMDAGACRYLEGKLGIAAINSDRPQDVLAEQPSTRVIVLWHVLEHLLAPWEVLEAAVRTLEPGGLLAVSTPNPSSIQFRLARGRWAHLDAPRHLFLVPPATLIERMRELGLSCASFTTSDPAGLLANHLGWEYVMLRDPARQAPTRGTSTAARLLETVLGPLERRGANGSTYTALFVKVPGHGDGRIRS